MATIQIQIPQQYLTQCLNRGWSEQESIKLFSQYIKQLIEDGYNQTLYNFLDWTEDLDEEDFEYQADIQDLQ